jgi:hypothetical protein
VAAADRTATATDETVYTARFSVFEMMYFLELVPIDVCKCFVAPSFKTQIMLHVTDNMSTTDNAPPRLVKELQLAFAMGTHARLGGQRCPYLMMPTELVELLLRCEMQHKGRGLR